MGGKKTTRDDRRTVKRKGRDEEEERKEGYVWGPFSPTRHSGVSVVLHFSHRRPLGRGGRPRERCAHINITKEIKYNKTYTHIKYKGKEREKTTR